jgi:hypothetical protein
MMQSRNWEEKSPGEKSFEIDVLHDLANKAEEKLLSQHEWYIHRNNKKRKMITQARKHSKNAEGFQEE